MPAQGSGLRAPGSDLEVIDEDKDAIVCESVDLCKASEITLKYEGRKPTALIK